MRTKRRRQKPAASRQRQSSMETRRQRQRTRVRQQKPPLQPTPQSRLQRESPRMWLKRAASTSSTGATAAMLAVLCCIPCSAAVLLPYCVLAHVFEAYEAPSVCSAPLMVPACKPDPFRESRSCCENSMAGPHCVLGHFGAGCGKEAKKRSALASSEAPHMCIVQAASGAAGGAQPVGCAALLHHHGPHLAQGRTPAPGSRRQEAAAPDQGSLLGLHPGPGKGGTGTCMHHSWSWLAPQCDKPQMCESLLMTGCSPWQLCSHLPQYCTGERELLR